MKFRLFIAVFAGLCVLIAFNRQNVWQDRLFNWDQSGYHIYLPAVFIYHDVETFSFYKGINQKYGTSPGVEWYALHDQPAGKRLNKYPIGVACLELPFFLVAYLYCNVTSYPVNDGYSLPYQWAAIFSVLFWVIAALVFLHNVLKRYYPEHIALFTVICVALGTNLYNYTVFDIGMSHPYSFFLFSALLYFTDSWHRKPGVVKSCILGAIAGMILMTRLSNIPILLLPFIWGVYNGSTAQSKLVQLWRIRGQIACFAVCLLLVFSLQMVYWKSVTDQWLFYSYVGEGFNFLHPRIGVGLLSFRKGWFVYTPIVALAICGFYFLWRRDKGMALPLMGILTVAIYIVFSWRCWWYGNSFGARAMIEYCSILSLPLAALLDRMRKMPGPICIFSFILFPLLIALNMFQSYQMAYGVLHSDRMNKKAYLKIIGRTELTNDIRSSFMTDEEVEKENKRSYGK